MEKINEAYETIKKAIDIDPDNPYIKLTEIEVLAEIDKRRVTKVLTEYLEETEEYREVICEESKERKFKEKLENL
ncbi:hypothetical protein [Saccharolobus islandicus]|nr:hypothetical protein [Sulfolobus islandicus]